MCFQLQHELLDNAQDDLFRKRCEADDSVKAIAELWRERPFDCSRILAFAPFAAKPDGFFGLLRGTRIGRHDEHDIAEIHSAPIVIGEFAVVHHLQQDVVDIRMRLFHLIEEKNTMRMLIHTVCQHAALVKADVSGRGPDQTGHGVFLHVLRHVKPQKFHTQRIGQLLGHLGLTYASGTSEKVVADGFFRLTQTRTGKLDR